MLGIATTRLIPGDNRTVNKLLRTFRTVRYLQPRQLYWQVRHRLLRRESRLPAAANSSSWQTIVPPASNSLQTDRWNSLLAPVPPQSRNQLLSGQVCFLNTNRQFFATEHADDRSSDLHKIDWRCDGASLLWRYNLHYFDWLWSLDPQEPADRTLARVAIEQWWETVDPEVNRVGWAPYPMSLRLLNWSLLFFGRWYEAFRDDLDFLGRLAWTIKVQQAELLKRLEFHLGANHLLENLVAVHVCEDILCSGSTTLSPQITSLLGEQLREQFLGDGCHYERSPMYHLRMLWLLDVLRRLNIFGQGTSRRIDGYYERALDSLARLCHADGKIALLNDAAFDIYNGDLLHQDRCQPGIWSLPDAGYYGALTDEGESLIIDAGPIGPDHQPGHAHADTFSFEWSLDGERFVTDTGVYGYEVDPFRLWTRQTEAHNSVTLDNCSSSEVWSGFRVGRRAHVTIENWELGDRWFRLAARHDGFKPLMHHREFIWSPGKLQITDRITPGKSTSIDACSFLHFSPETEVRLDLDGAECRIGQRIIRIDFQGCDKTALKQTWYCPRFGEKTPRQALQINFGVKSATCKTTLRSAHST